MAVSSHADDQTRAVQQILKDQGFYYGEVDGESGNETNAAVRRYQIRNGLEVTGKLNHETVMALHIGNATDNEPPAITSEPQTPSPEPVAPPPAVATTPRPTLVESDRNFLRRQQPTAQPESAEQSEPIAPPPPPPGVTFSAIFDRTPYQRAPSVVQHDTLKRAQIRLYRDGWYRGGIDGDPGPETVRAIRLYQRDAELPETGRLDMATLSDMNLLPRNRQIFSAPGPIPGRNPDDFDEPPARRVFRGIWVR